MRSRNWAFRTIQLGPFIVICKSCSPNGGIASVVGVKGNDARGIWIFRVAEVSQPQAVSKVAIRPIISF